jgi:hypothetical protein
MIAWFVATAFAQSSVTGCDLVLSSAGSVWYSNNIAHVQIKNIGWTECAGGFWVDVWVSRPTEPQMGDLSESWVFFRDPIPPGGFSETLYVGADGIGRTGGYWVDFVINTDVSVDEYTVQNNVWSFLVRGPDWSVAPHPQGATLVPFEP